MNTRSALALIAGSATLFVSITPALSYYPSQVGGYGGERISQRTGNLASTASFSSRSTVTSRASSSSSAKKLTVGCITQAVDRRETAIATSLDEFYNTMKQLLELRSSLVIKYWAYKDAKERDSNIRTVWRTFGQSWRTNAALMNEKRREAWKVYRDERSACGIYDPGDPEMGGLKADSQY